MLASAVWSVGYGAELSSTNTSAAQFWLGFQYLGIPFLGVCWLGMVRELSGEPPWSQQTWLTLLAPGFLSCLLALTTRTTAGCKSSPASTSPARFPS